MPPTPPVPIPKGSSSEPAANNGREQAVPPFRLQTRRGSRSAPDPWALGALTPSSVTTDNSSSTATGGGATGSGGHPTPASSVGTATATPSTSASRITIVRVHDDSNARPESAPDSADVSDGTSSYGDTGPRPGRSNSWGSNYSNNSNPSNGRSHSPGSGRRFGGRMTFAFSSFTPINPPEKSPATERGRPFSHGPASGGSTSTPATPENVSPTQTYSSHQQQAGGHIRRRTHSNPGLAPMKPSLTAQQIYELALSSTASLPPASPNANAELAAFASSPASGGASPIHTSSASLHRAHSTSRPATPGLTGTTSPAIFRPMPEEVYLPFIDRPAEVAALLNEQPTSRLFHLLKALFPPDMRTSQSATSRQCQESPEDSMDDPKKWTFERLSNHLMTTTRAQMGDKAWTDAARACIRGRSEALWERFKGALGVPAELEMEDEDGDEDDLDLAGNVQYAESEGAIDLGGDAESLRRNPLSGSTGDLASLGHITSEREAVLEPVFADQSGSEDGDDDVEELDDDEAALGGEGRIGQGEGIGRHLPDWSTGALSEGGWSGRVMENIGEGSDEEAEVYQSKAKHGHHHRASHGELPTQTAEFEDYSYPYPQREIRALQITTSIASPLAPAPTLGVHSSPRFRTGAPSSLSGGDGEDGLEAGRGPSPPPHVSTAHFPHAHYREIVDSTLPKTAGSVAPPTTSTTAAPAAASDNTAPRVVLRRPSESIAQALSATGGPAGGGSHAGAIANAAGYRGFGGYGLAPANGPYHPALSERGPGNPLFPSSFAGLSVGPTLLANVPKASRSVSISHGSHYPSSLSPSSRNAPSGGPGSDVALSGSPSSLRRYASLTESRRVVRSTWQDVRDRYEYAVTVASASSDGGRG